MAKMDRDKSVMENLIYNWNQEFPNYELNERMLKEPHALIQALLLVFDRLGINQTVLCESPEDNINQSFHYYRDLLPVINMTRVINHLFLSMPQMGPITISEFLQPVAMSSTAILVVMFNWVHFIEEKLDYIAPYEEEMFQVTKMVGKLEEQKHKLLEMRNEQAHEKANRVIRLEKINEEKAHLEDELKQESDACDEEKLEQNAILKENRQTDLLLEQKRTHLDALNAELARKKALRVYDADDVMAQMEQANRNVLETEQRCEALRATLMQKEDVIKNLKTIKPGLDSANHLLQEITKLSDSLIDMESGDLESDSIEGELDVLNTELEELQAARRELCAARDDMHARHEDAQGKRQLERNTQQSALREASERDRRNCEQSVLAARRTEEIKQRTLQYEREKARGGEEIGDISDHFYDQLKYFEEKLIAQMLKLEELVKQRQRDL